MKKKGFILLGTLLTAFLLCSINCFTLAAELTPSTIPATGDRSYLPVAIAVLAASAVGIAAVVIIPRLRKKK